MTGDSTFAAAPRAVGILGGMGPAAGVDFARLFVEACTELLRERGLPVTDQAYPPHWLAQLPVPDRSAALRAGGAALEPPLAMMSAGLAQLEAAGAVAVAIACNTAHAWHGQLQARHPDIELLHIADETAAALRARGIGEAALLATEGTYRNGLYEKALLRAGIACRLPLPDERARLMEGIYQGVKAGDPVCAEACFVDVGQRLRARHGDLALIMGCTEIPLALPAAPAAQGWTLIDPAQVLARALARRAYRPVAASTPCLQGHDDLVFTSPDHPRA